MPPQPEAHIISDHNRLSANTYYKILGTFFGIVLLIGGAYAVYVFYRAPILQAEREQKESDEVINSFIVNATPFSFTIVPDALTTFAMPVQDNSTATKAALGDEFVLAQASFLDPKDSEIPNIFDMPVGEITYLDYMNELPRFLQDPFLQMLSEVEVLVATLNQQHTQATLASRIGKEEELLFKEATVTLEGKLSVYPSMRVAQAHFAAEVLARQLPSEAAFFREYADSFIQAGVAYGHYSQLDANLTQMLINDYLNAAEKNELGSLVLQSFEQ